MHETPDRLFANQSQERKDRSVDQGGGEPGGTPEERLLGTINKKGGQSFTPLPHKGRSGQNATQAVEPTSKSSAQAVTIIPPNKGPASGIPSDYSRPLSKRQARHAAFLARQQLTGKFTEDLMTIWAARGPEVLNRAADQNPVAFAKMVADLLPKQLDMNVDVVHELEDDQLGELIDAISARLGSGIEQTARTIESRAGEEGGEE